MRRDQSKIRETTYFGEHDLPEEQQKTLQKAIRVERINIVTKVIAVIAIFSVAGNSQAMKAAWIEDSLAILPPLAFLIALRFINRKPTPRHPYGYHRAMGIGHLVAAVALLGFGTMLLVDSAMGLFAGEHPAIGLIEIFGMEIWQGWIMVVVSVIVVIPAIIIGRINAKLAPPLHNKVLYADADMNKADWMTGIATAVGLTGVGFGLWWFDAAVAIFISFDIINDGYKNVRGGLAGLIDARATTTNMKDPHPLIQQVREQVMELDWVDEADVRMRDLGMVFHTEVFVVPYQGQMPPLDEVERIRKKLSESDWKLHDLVIIPVAELPEEFLPQIDQKEV
ncbi:cation transporter [Enteractinococcus fodinae]|uniref:Cation diffusion facilitator family transporter n=1 Tax=Enteractinococcus fodinae TaxID=684663 RepID=A0ABU2AXE2_9MICC|nr:cation transporter [Enteractinococcus fodinae]MDR7346020.1 cation diffusion facilitator family transporter [Enteractinococcus fodinae]